MSNKEKIIDNKNLVEEWNYDKNKKLDIEQTTINSTLKIWWKCNKGHEWQATSYDRNRGSGCPYCSNQKILKGYNDLLTTNSKLAKEWNYEKNIIKPTEISSGSKKKVYWKCDKGHEWEAIIKDRNRGSKCPYCSNSKVLAGYNDLLTINPELAKEWNYEKNGILTPDKVFPGSEKKVWWKCSKGHEFFSVIKSRNNGSGCPECIKEKRVSFPEKTILFYLKKYFKNACGSYRTEFLGNREIDIYIPEIKLGIEYDGQHFHKNDEKDLIKDRICKKNGITLIRIREPECPDLSPEYLYFKLKSTKLNDLEEAIEYIIDYINDNYQYNINPDINIDRDYIKVMELIGLTEKENSLLSKNSKLSKEWNYDKNGMLTPDKVYSKSSRKVWWKCEKGHEWQASIANRSNNNDGCPYCTNVKVLTGFNDLSTTNPEVAKEWNFEKNTDNLLNINSKSGKKVWWKCDKGHEWEATILSRTINKTSCPFCSGLKAIAGENDITITHPKLIKEWNYNRNHSLVPNQFKYGSNKKVWWKCNKGHEWEETICNRTIGGRKKQGFGCPYCSNKRLLTGFNDLLAINPELAKEWDYEKNKVLTPEKVLFGSKSKVWWKCEKGHEWEAEISIRNTKKTTCPYCSNQKVLKGYNDLATTHHILSNDWNYKKNSNLNPDSVSFGSGKKVWWKCSECGYEWQAIISSRVRGNKCPICANQKVLVGYNDLSTTIPNLIEEWNFERNKDILPTQFTSGSGKVVWWTCKTCGKIWKQRINHRANGVGCPNCSKKKQSETFRINRIKNEGLLFDNYQELMKEWDWEKNIDYDPKKLLSGSSCKVNWICKNCGHNWITQINVRTNGHGCPRCNRKKI